MLDKKQQDQVQEFMLASTSLQMFGPGADGHVVRRLKELLDELFDGDTKEEVRKCCGLYDFDKGGKA